MPNHPHGLTDSESEELEMPNNNTQGPIRYNVHQPTNSDSESEELIMPKEEEDRKCRVGQRDNPKNRIKMLKTLVPLVVNQSTTIKMPAAKAVHVCPPTINTDHVHQETVTQNRQDNEYERARTRVRNQPWLLDYIIRTFTYVNKYNTT